MNLLLASLIYGLSLSTPMVTDGEPSDASKTIVQVIDAKTGEPIIGATVQFSCLEESLYTSPDGTVEIENIDEDCSVKISYVSYSDYSVSVGQLSKNKVVALGNP